MYSFFKENQYPDQAAKTSLAEELGITFEQVIQLENCFIILFKIYFHLGER